MRVWNRLAELIMSEKILESGITVNGLLSSLKA